MLDVCAHFKLLGLGTELGIMLEFLIGTDHQSILNKIFYLGKIADPLLTLM